MDFVNEIIGPILQPILITIAAIIGRTLHIGVNRFLDEMQRRTGLEIEKADREAIHSALDTGVANALARGLTGAELVQAAEEHARDGGAPEALARMKPSREALKNIIRRKLVEKVGDQAGKILGGALGGVPGAIAGEIVTDVLKGTRD